MPPWDQGNWDSQDEVWDVETTTEKKRMFEINLNLKNINAGALATRLNSTVTAMTGNAAFPTPAPALAELTAKASALSAKIIQRDAAKAVAKAHTSEIDDLVAEGKDLLKDLGNYVGKTAETEAQVQSVLMSVKGKPTDRPAPERIEGLDLTPSDTDGALDAQWDADDDATMYDVETNDDPDNAATWKHHCACTDSHQLITGLTSGARVWVRVRGRNAAGAGPWSDVAVRRAP